ncbi:hypothetical protein EDD90_7395 [Streptomyces sp. Ag109_O5-1]|uniref:hypothetical protein n=1 Tax=Streptomyces sp. Ag109_O5-1 TaxID=1938851 RepID=UPI000F4E021F|nr:hypothetical protein [Streptomyces sp. Ag109_O5-1]RPE44165.1 hypothetical protein EDD90_7395 [Streptomyces sp. Ag109_O5-1]
MFKLTVENVVYEFDGDHLLLAEAREIKTYTGMTLPKWSRGIDEMDPDAIQSLIYLAKKRAGETLRYSDLDSLDFADIDLEPMKDEEEAEGEPKASQEAVDPTPPGETGTTPTPGTTDTSDPSPTTSSTPPATSAV